VAFNGWTIEPVSAFNSANVVIDGMPYGPATCLQRLGANLSMARTAAIRHPQAQATERPACTMPTLGAPHGWCHWFPLVSASLCAMRRYVPPSGCFPRNASGIPHHKLGIDQDFFISTLRFCGVGNQAFENALSYAIARNVDRG